MKREEKMTAKQVVAHLKEALMPFCEEEGGWRTTFLKPFRQEDCVIATDGKVLVCVRTKEAGCSVSPFAKMEKPNALSVIPEVGFERQLKARTVRRRDLAKTIERMQKMEEKEKQAAVANMGGVLLSIEGLSNIEKAMRICGAEAGELVWSEGYKVMAQLLNADGQVAVEVLQMGMAPEKKQIVEIPLMDYKEGDPVCINWQQGVCEWADVKAELERKAEAERMARREVYMVEVVKRAHIPVYAKNAKDAEEIVKSSGWFDPEDAWDSEWTLGDYVPEVEDLDDLADCYKTILTRDGEKDRDGVREMEQISEEWARKNGTTD